MNIRKRTGEVVPFQEEKILNAMKKAFSGQGQEIDDRALDEMLSVVLKRLPENGGLTVERVQDEVERVLMECGHYEVAKAYILLYFRTGISSHKTPSKPVSTPLEGAMI